MEPAPLIPNVYLTHEEFISPYHFVTQATAECLELHLNGPAIFTSKHSAVACVTK
jgi:hypothetical protein